MTEKHTGFESFDAAEQAYLREERERRDIIDLMEDREHVFSNPGDVCGFNGCSSMACKRLGYCPYRVRDCGVLQEVQQMEPQRKRYISAVRAVAGKKGRKGKGRKGPRLRSLTLRA